MTKERKFVREYLKHFNASKAAIAVGCSERSAGELGHRLLKKVEESGLLSEIADQDLKEAGVEKVAVLKEISKLAFSNMGDYIVPTDDGQFDVNTELAREEWAAVQEITVDTTGGSGDGERRRVLRTRLKLAPKKDSLELLAKHLNLLTERKEVQLVGKDGGPIQTSIQVSFVTPDAATS